MKQPIPFGKYYLLERVNVGGMAEVFKAKATGVEGFERLVAVKRILPSIAEDEEFITMFIDEAKIAVQLTHANIAQIFDLGKVGDSFFIALEYVQGKDLRAIFNRCRNRGEPMAIPLACYAIMKVCEGLDYAHQKTDASGRPMSLVHRDVSPQNLLVSYEGEVKIIDFGIAKAAGKAGKTQAGILKGKFGYMSPEQVQGMEIDRRSDVFGLGICLYELLTGERLFVAETDFATLEKVRNVEIMPPSTYNRRIPEDLEQIVLRALSKDRDERHQSAMELHDELQGYLYGSGNQFGRKELSAFMHRLFGEEIEREHQRDQAYASMSLEGDSGEDELLRGLASGSNVRGLPSHGSSPGGIKPVKSTLLGMPQGYRPPTGPPPVVPPLSPRPQSIPPSTVPVQPAGGGQPGLDMEWDDDELSTQIYDKPEDLARAMQVHDAPGNLGASMPPVLQASDYGVTSQPNLGQPAPFGAGPSMPAPPAQPLPGQPLPRVNPRQDPTDLLLDAGGDPFLQRSQERKGRNLWVVLVAVAAILGTIVIALLAFRGGAAPGYIELRTTPEDATVRLDGVDIPGRSPFLLQDVEPSKQHTVEVAKPGYRAWSGRVELEPGQTMAMPAVTLESEKTGFSVDSTPSGAAVLVDGVDSGLRTPATMDSLPPGNHVVRLTLADHEPWTSTTLHVTAGTILPLPPVELAPVAEEEEPEEAEAPTHHRAVAHRAPVRTPRPEHAPSASSEPKRPVVLLKEDPAEEEEPEVEASEEIAEPEEEDASGVGFLRINSRPWSTVIVDGKTIGPTPQMRIEVSSGSHEITLRNDEFGIEKSFSVSVPAGETVTKVLTLQ